ncbi:MAG: ribonuclease Z [Flavobacteriaceae bacterium]
MVLDKKGNVTIVFQEKTDLSIFMANLLEQYPKIENDHLIINLFSFDDITANGLLEFLQISNDHRGKKKSFVLVTQKVAFDELPETLCVVPTVQEAHDIIQMEEIERDLGL